MALIDFLPLKFISQIAGNLSERNFNKSLLLPFLQKYISHYKVNMAESLDPLESFESFSQFFSRKLKPDLRPIVYNQKAIASPVDGTISQSGEVEAGKLMQVKGKEYTLESLVGNSIFNKYSFNLYQTIYLSPADYHRIHFPITGKIIEILHIPGSYYPVNNWAVNNIENIFCKNERIVVVIENNNSKIALLLVGALIVGKIKFTADEIIQNYNFNPQGFTFNKKFEYNKGLEMAHFLLGSTVIILYDRQFVELTKMNGRVKFGEEIANFKQNL